jgi:hypothetical protein
VTRRAARAVAGIAAAGTVVAAAAVAAAAVAATGGAPATVQRTSLRVAYECRDSAGSLRVPVTVAARFPARVPTGRVITPTGATVAIALPPAVVADLATAQVAAVGGTARLTLPVTQGRSTAAVTWSGLSWPATLRPASGGLTLTASGAVPAVRASAAGPVTFTVGKLALTLVSRPPGAVATAPSPSSTPSASARPSVTGPAASRPATARPTSAPGASTPTTSTPGTSGPTPAALRLSCRPAAGQHVVLAKVGGGPVAAAKHPVSYCPAPAKGGYKLNPRWKPPRVPKGIIIHHPTPSLGCAWVAGFADVRKLNGASYIGPARISVAVGINLDYNFDGHTYFQEDSAGMLDYRLCHSCKLLHGLPPVKATFLTFGFMPTTATMQLTEVGTVDLFGVGTTSQLSVNYSYAEMSLKISDVRVNGAPLNVSTHCRAERPFTIELYGRADSHPSYSLQFGGPLTGDVDIPQFTGCAGGGENLDKLFNAAIAGPRNFAELTQGTLCTPASDSGCPPEPVRRPLH